MFRPNNILALGIWLIILSFLGVPSSWRTGLCVATGLFLITLYFKAVGRESLRKFLRERSADTFTQNKPQKAEVASKDNSSQV